MNPQIKNLDTFFSPFPFLQPGPEYCYQWTQNIDYPTLCLAAAIHGNEVGGVFVLEALLKRIKNKNIQFPVNLKIIIGNPKAYQQNVRYTQTDLNRCFCLENPVTYEQLRAQEILKFVAGTQVLIDLHQTIEACATPFLIFNYTESNAELAQAINLGHPMVVFKQFSTAKATGVGFSTAYNHVAGAGITVEMGQMGYFDTQIEYGLKIIDRTIQWLTGDKPEAFPTPTLYTWGESISNLEKELELIPGLQNFSKVEIGSVIGKNIKTGEVLKAKCSGPVLFPKYGAQAISSNEIIRILKQIDTFEDL